VLTVSTACGGLLMPLTSMPMGPDPPDQLVSDDPADGSRNSISAGHTTGLLMFRASGNGP